MKAAASVLLTLACTLYGVYLRTMLFRRVRVLREWCAFLREIRTQIGSLHTPFPELVHRCADTFPALPFLADCSARCAEGVPFPAAWNDAVQQFLRTGSFPDRESKLFSGWAGTVAAANAQQIAETLEGYIRSSESCLQCAEEKSASGGKLCVRVCGAVGALLGILIL